MLAMPITCFLVSESSGVSGLLTLIWLSGLLRLYARPLLTKERSYFLRVALTSSTHILKQIAYTLMGFSLPLHLKHTQTRYTVAIVSVFVMPVLSSGSYCLINRLLKREAVVNWYRCASQSGLVSYMLAL
jgi:hypothetical protein